MVGSGRSMQWATAVRASVGRGTRAKLAGRRGGVCMDPSCKSALELVHSMCMQGWRRPASCDSSTEHRPARRSSTTAIISSQVVPFIRGRGTWRWPWLILLSSPLSQWSSNSLCHPTAGELTGLPLESLPGLNFHIPPEGAPKIPSTCLLAADRVGMTLLPRAEPERAGASRWRLAGGNARRWGWKGAPALKHVAYGRLTGCGWNAPARTPWGACPLCPAPGAEGAGKPGLDTRVGDPRAEHSTES